MVFERLTLTVEQGLARLEFNNVVRGNAIDEQFCAEISEAATQLSVDPAVRCVLITAKGDAFGYGGDISSFVNDLASLPANIKRWTTTFHSGIARLQRMDAPIVAAVHGVCAGGMSAFVAGADILVASDDATFVAAYPGIGFSCDAGSTIMYARRMGAARARRFLLLNESLDADSALACGLADEVCSREEFQQRAETIARKLASGPTKAYGEIRRLMLTVFDQPLETQLELEAQALSRTSGTSDAGSAILAFTERRRPEFGGN